MLHVKEPVGRHSVLEATASSIVFYLRLGCQYLFLRPKFVLWQLFLLSGLLGYRHLLMVFEVGPPCVTQGSNSFVVRVEWSVWVSES